MDETVKFNSHTNESLLEKVAASLPGVIFQVVVLTNGSCQIIYASSGCQELCELEPKAVLADFQILRNLIHPGDIQTFIDTILVVNNTIAPWCWEGRIVTPSGRLKWVQLSAHPKQEANGAIIWEGLVMDVTAHKVGSENLRASEARYKAILDAIPDLMFRINANGEYIDFRGEGANVTIPRDEIIGKSLWDFLPPDVASNSYAAIRQTLASRSLQRCEYQLPTPLGVRDYEARLVVSGDEEVLAIVRDITESKRSEISQKVLTEKFSKAFSCSPDPITISSLSEGKYIEVNESFVRLTGWKRHEVVGKTAFELNIWVNQSDRCKLLQELELKGVVRNLEFEFRRKSGEIIVAQLSAEVIDLEGVKCILAINKDITERKKAEAQLQMTSRRDHLLAQTLSRIRTSLNLNQILQTTVGEVRQFLNADRVFIALNNTQVQSRVLAESVDSRYPSVLNWRHSDGENKLFKELNTSLAINQIRVVENIAQVNVSPELKALYQLFHTQATLAVPIMQGEELFGALIANQCTTPRHWQPIEIDLVQQIAEQLALAIEQAQLHEELAVLNSNLEHQVQERTAQLQQKVQEIQDLNRIKDVVLHTVSHDLRTSVLGNLMVLNNLVKAGEEKQLETPPPIPNNLLERMIQGNERQLGMINSLLEINSSDAKEIIMHPELVQFDTLIKAIIQDVASLLNRYQSQLKNLVRNNIAMVNADQELLRKVFVALLTCSCQNNPPGVNFTLKAKVNDKQIYCTIQNNGTGISKSECETFFDLHVHNPQSRSKTIDSLKLYMCRQIIKAHGGEIGVISNRKQGLTFWFTLPISEE